MFYLTNASGSLDIRRGEQLKVGTEAIGNRTRIKVVKNKVAPPFRTAEVDIIYGEGMSKMGTLLDMAVDRDIIHKSGAWFSYEDLRIGQGRENARTFLKENPEISDKIDKIIRTEAMAQMEQKAPVDMEEELQEADEQLAAEDPDLALLDDLE